VELARASAHAAAIAAIAAAHAAPTSASAARHLLAVAATSAARGLVLESTFAVERLLSRREHEFLAAVAAFDSLVDISHEASGYALATKKKRPPAGKNRQGLDG